MLEIIVLVLGVLILLSLKGRNFGRSPEPRPHFNEEFALPPEREGKRREFQFYTFSEFNETREISIFGLKKTLGFSKFPLVFDCTEEKIKSAGVCFTATDGLTRSKILGLLEFLNEEEDWLEIEIRLSAEEYESLFKQLKDYAFMPSSAPKYFLLYSISVELGVITKSKRSLNIIRSIHTVGAYHESDAHKIRAMIKLDEGKENSDPRYRQLCEEYGRRFDECLTETRL